MADEGSEQVSAAAEVYVTAATVGGEFESHAIVGAGVEVRGIGGGLTAPMEYGPITFEAGQPFCLVLSGFCKGVRFDPEDKDDLGGDLVRVSILKVEEGTFVSEDVVLDALKRQRAINDEGRRLAEEKSGISRLNFAGTDDEEFDLATAHANGEHEAEMVAHCPVCDALDPEDGDVENEQAVMVRQHLAGVHADGLRPTCIMCSQESEAMAREAAEDAPE